VDGNVARIWIVPSYDGKFLPSQNCISSPSYDGAILISGTTEYPAMTLYEVTFKLQHECPFNDLSKEHPTAIISHWCNYVNDVLEISADNLDSFDSLQQSIDKLTRNLGVEVLRKVFTKANQQLVTQHCGCNHYRSTSPVIESNHCLELQPTIYKGGWEWYRIIAFTEKDIRRLFQQLDEFCEVEVTSRRAIEEGSVRETLLISTASLFGELTNRQQEALSIAVESGYYRVPKKVTTEDIANRMGVPRTTFEEHLRKAESKLLQAVAPYMQLRQGQR